MDISGVLAMINAVLWHEYVLYAIVGTGVMFTVWSGFSQYWSLRHGPAVVRGEYDDPDDPGAINHFQALATALSATVGLGNIGGVALAIALGGPGAVFWMWVVGLLGMAIKLTEVTLSMLYRNTDDADNPHGGPMWVAARALERANWPRLGRAIGIIFCLSMLVSTATGGNMFQAWNVGEITQEYYGVPSWISGIILALIVGAVIIGGIKRIGKFAATVVPTMVAAYLIAGLGVLFANFGSIPAMFALIIEAAFSPATASGAFVGGSVFFAFQIGMKRAIFSNEAGQGSSPMVHAAAKTDEPVREGIVAGLEPFIDTIVVCTFTALIILSTGIWNRAPDISFDVTPQFVASGSSWTLPNTITSNNWTDGESAFVVVSADPNKQTANSLHKVAGVASATSNGFEIIWSPVDSNIKPTVIGDGFYRNYVGATLTAKAFDSVLPGLGKWVIVIATWLFAISTMISWSYYGEQGVVFMGGEKPVLTYKLFYCALIILATLGFVKTDADLDNVIGVGTGIILFANIPICWMFGYQAMRAYKDYIRRLKSGSIGPDHPKPSLDDLLSGRDVERD
ncbi:MAG: alanine:cation symporter family protein [Woeseiaceae bacterium]|nr:alanine:cation symporter family protein [Woeseiaceae bacterium]